MTGTTASEQGSHPSTTAATPGTGDRPPRAELNNPYAVAVDSSGNLYIADTYNHRIRKVDTSGIITTVAGNGLCG